MESKEIKTEIKKNLCKCGKEKKGQWKNARFCSLLCYLNNFTKYSR